MNSRHSTVQIESFQTGFKKLKNMKIDFKHRQFAHCESGVTANLLFHYGTDISEALAFGIGGGLFFGYIPFIRLNYLPLTTFRIATGRIFKRVTQRLGIKVKRQKFKDREKAMEVLDSVINRKIPVGCQTGAFWLPYFPSAYRFHFNMHNLIVYGKEENKYLVSDPVFPRPVVISCEDLMHARFAKGAMAPKGKMYYLSKMPDHIDFPKAVIKGIKDVCNSMLKIPIFLFGIKGIRYLAEQIESWPEKLGEHKASLYLGQVVRMQEEIGTGGAGFRFMYAAFLQEAAGILGESRLYDISGRLTNTGDRWREFAVSSARICKGRALETETYRAMADILRDCAVQEEELFCDMKNVMAKNRRLFLMPLISGTKCQNNKR